MSACWRNVSCRELLFPIATHQVLTVWTVSPVYSVTRKGLLDFVMLGLVSKKALLYTELPVRCYCSILRTWWSCYHGQHKCIVLTLGGIPHMRRTSIHTDWMTCSHDLKAE